MPNNIIMADKPSGEWTTEGIANGSEPSGEITLYSAPVPYGFAYNKNISVVKLICNEASMSNAFMNSNITEVYASGFSHLNGSNFQGCTQLTKVIFYDPLNKLGGQQFRDCKNLRTVVIAGSSGNVEVAVFYGCNLLQSVDFSTNNIGANEFYSCSSLSHIILRRADRVTVLDNVNAFIGSSLASGGTGCAIYIPKALYDHLGDGTSLDYKAATNWSTIDGYGTITWVQIEGSIYETQYADGTPIPSE